MSIEPSLSSPLALLSVTEESKVWWPGFRVWFLPLTSWSSESLSSAAFLSNFRQFSAVKIALYESESFSFVWWKANLELDTALSFSSEKYTPSCQFWTTSRIPSQVFHEGAYRAVKLRLIDFSDGDSWAIDTNLCLKTNFSKLCWSGRKLGSITSRCSGVWARASLSSSRGGAKTGYERAAEIEPNRTQNSRTLWSYSVNYSIMT